MASSIKITELTNIGSNLAPSTILPVVNVVGTAVTQKANLQIVGNLILAGAGGANFVPAARALQSATVTNAAQPNITSVGTLSIDTLHISGGSSSQVLSTDGAGNLSWATQTGGNGGSAGDRLVNGLNELVLEADGNVTLPSGSPLLFGNGNSRIQAGMGFHISSEEGISLEAVDITDPLNPVTAGWYFGTDSILTLPGNINSVNGINLLAGDAVNITSNNTVAAKTWNFDEAGNLTLPAGGDIKDSTGTSVLVPKGVPQIAFTASTTTALTDAGKHYYSVEATNLTLTVATNTAVAFPIGTAITVVNQGTGTITIQPDTGVTMYLAGDSVATSRTVSSYGMATLLKVATDVWFINGAGVA